MPFRAPDDCPVQVCGYELIPACLAYANEIVRGDALCVEVGRRDGNLLFLLLDVAGHGRVAHPIILHVQQLLSDPACQNLTPMNLLQRLNGMLSLTFLTTSRFVASMAVLMDSQGQITMSNAGLPHPWTGSPGTTWTSWTTLGGTPLGIGEADEQYQQDSRSKAHQDLFLTFTDGVTEAGAAQGFSQAFGPRIPAFLGQLPASWPCHRIVLSLLEELQRHVAQVSVATQSAQPWPNDDLTILGVVRS
jgi:serine phosphatase RsbU (regulator of sigma subunit)